MCLARTTYGGPVAYWRARRVARAALQDGLAACTHMSAVRSTYSWKGKMRSETEVLLEFRTPRTKVDALRRAVLRAHPYENPLFEVIDVRAVPDAYLRWAGA